MLSAHACDQERIKRECNDSDQWTGQLSIQKGSSDQFCLNMMLIYVSYHKAFHERKSIYQILLEESLKNGLFDVFKLLHERGTDINSKAKVIFIS